MSELQDILDWSVAEGDLPFVVGMAADRNGIRSVHGPVAALRGTVA